MCYMEITTDIIKDLFNLLQINSENSFCHTGKEQRAGHLCTLDTFLVVNVLLCFIFGCFSINN